MKKIERNDWFEAGLRILETAGFMKITIENLCGVLSVTKGSFYHHFGNVEGYIEALMQYWADENTRSLIEKLAGFERAEERSKALNGMVLLRSHKREQMIRGWGFAHDVVGKYVREVDEIRMDYTAELMRKCGLEPRKAKRAALLEYACLIGIQQLSPQMPVQELEELHRIFSSGTDTLK